MSSPPLGEPGHRAGLLFQAAGSFVRGLALASGPGPGFASVRPRRIRLCNLAILSWPAVARGERIGGGPVYHARLTELECLAGPSAPRLVSPHLGSELTPAQLRACRAAQPTRADVTAPHSCETVAPTSGSELALKSRSATQESTNRLQNKIYDVSNPPADRLCTKSVEIEESSTQLWKHRLRSHSGAARGQNNFMDRQRREP